jgi:hypothetical protein
MKRFILCSLLILVGCATVNSNSTDELPRMKKICNTDYGTVYSYYVKNHGYIFVYEGRLGSNISGSITTSSY